MLRKAVCGGTDGGTKSPGRGKPSGAALLLRSQPARTPAAGGQKENMRSTRMQAIKSIPPTKLTSKVSSTADPHCLGGGSSSPRRALTMYRRRLSIVDTLHDSHTTPSKDKCCVSTRLRSRLRMSIAHISSITTDIDVMTPVVCVNATRRFTSRSHQTSGSGPVPQPFDATATGEISHPIDH